MGGATTRNSLKPMLETQIGTAQKEEKRWKVAAAEHQVNPA